MTTKAWSGGAWVTIGDVMNNADMWWPAAPYVSNPGTGSSTVLLDASGEYVAFIFQAPKSGVIDRLRFQGGALTTNPSVADCRLETVAATGDPSGTLAGTTSNGAVTINAANSIWEATLTTPLTVTQGDWLCFKVAWTSGAFNVIREPNAGNSLYWGGLYGAQSIGGVASRFSNGPMPFGIRYNDGLYAKLDRSIVAAGTITNNFISTTNPDERGIKFVPPFSCKATGMWFAKGTGAGARTLKLYNAADSVLWSLAWDPDFMSGTNPMVFLRFNSDINLTGGAIYRLTCLATDATNIQLCEITVPTGLGVSLPGGTSVIWTQRNDAGAWTDTSDKQAAMGLLLSGVVS